MKRNHASATVRMTGERTGIIYEEGRVYYYRFHRRGRDRRPEWHVKAVKYDGDRLRFVSHRAERNYKTLMPKIDPADIKLMEAAFKQHVTNTREYRRSAKERNLAYVGKAMSRAAGWVREHKEVSQHHCLFFPNAVCYSPASARYNYQQMSAARVMCLETHGRPEDDRAVVRHKCGMGNMSCVNPAHLAWGSVQDNGRDTSLHWKTIYNPGDYPASDVAKVKNDPRLTNVIAWDLGIPSALVSAIKLAGAE